TYIRYGMHQLHEPDHQPYSLLIGKEPLMPLLYAIFGTLSGDYLVGARIVTVLFGALTLLGLYLFIKKITDKRVALVAGLLYVFAPYTLFFDRLALLDSGVSTIVVWSLYFSYKLFQNSRWLDAFSLGVVTGLGLWIKTSTLFYILLPILSYGALYLFDNAAEEKKISKIKMFGTALVLALLIFLPLFSNALYPEHMKLLQQYTYPFFSVFSFPLGVWWKNLSDVTSWVFFYLTPPLCLLAVGSIILFWKKKEMWLVSIWLLVPLVYEILYAKLFTSRHALLLVIPLLIFAAFGWYHLLRKNKAIAYSFVGLILLWSSVYNFRLLTDPQTYPSLYAGPARVDLEPYVYGFSSGYGVLDAIVYLQQQSTQQHIVVLVRNDHGNPEDAVIGYLIYNPNISVVPIHDATQLPQVFSQIDTSVPVYFVSRGAYYAGMEKYFANQKKFLKPSDTEFVGVELLTQRPH
ncbi:MAG: ArnT family glycosyltransferase, partial [Candidatus Levyibacteriota bacterium]